MEQLGSFHHLDMLELDLYLHQQSYLADNFEYFLALQSPLKIYFLVHIILS